MKPHAVKPPAGLVVTRRCPYQARNRSHETVVCSASNFRVAQFGVYKAIFRDPFLAALRAREPHGTCPPHPPATVCTAADAVGRAAVGARPGWGGRAPGGGGQGRRDSHAAKCCRQQWVAINSRSSSCSRDVSSGCSSAMAMAAVDYSDLSQAKRDAAPHTTCLSHL